MKKILSIAVLLAAAQLLAHADAVVGKPAPGFSVKDINGQTLQLSDYKGKLVVLENYNLDCPYDLRHYKTGSMQALQAEATGKGVVWLVVNSSYKDPSKAKTEVDSQKIKATSVIHDPSGVIGKEYGFKTTHHIIVVNKEGLVVYNGAIDDTPTTEGNPSEAHNYVRAALTQLLSGEPVSKPQTKPYGCGTKYAQ
jgi:peroxiredoxin